MNCINEDAMEHLDETDVECIDENTITFKTHLKASVTYIE